jgi:hypothetical protein
MPRRKKPTAIRRSEFSIHSVTLREEEGEILQRFSGYASDFLGRSMSNSAVIRALIRQMNDMEPSAIDALFAEVEKELNAGVMWGKKK